MAQLLRLVTSVSCEILDLARQPILRGGVDSPQLYAGECLIVELTFHYKKVVAGENKKLDELVSDLLLANAFEVWSKAMTEVSLVPCFLPEVEWRTTYGSTMIAKDAELVKEVLSETSHSYERFERTANLVTTEIPDTRQKSYSVTYSFPIVAEKVKSGVVNAVLAIGVSLLNHSSLPGLGTPQLGTVLRPCTIVCPCRLTAVASPMREGARCIYASICVANTWKGVLHVVDCTFDLPTTWVGATLGSLERVHEKPLQLPQAPQEQRSDLAFLDLFDVVSIADGTLSPKLLQGEEHTFVFNIGFTTRRIHKTQSAVDAYEATIRDNECLHTTAVLRYRLDDSPAVLTATTDTPWLPPRVPLDSIGKHSPTRAIQSPATPNPTAFKQQ